MNWDEKAESEAKRQADEWIEALPDQPPTTGQYQFRAGWETGGRYVAQWLLEQLRTDEAVERVADAILENFNPPDDKHSTWWINPESSARAAIAALIGEA